jgi:hypothetical protein
LDNVCDNADSTACRTIFDVRSVDDDVWYDEIRFDEFKGSAKKKGFLETIELDVVNFLSSVTDMSETRSNSWILIMTRG